jgi:hypothetical protein
MVEKNPGTIRRRACLQPSPSANPSGLDPLGENETEGSTKARCRRGKVEAPIFGRPNCQGVVSERACQCGKSGGVKAGSRIELQRIPQAASHPVSVCQVAPIKLKVVANEIASEQPPSEPVDGADFIGGEMSPTLVGKRAEVEGVYELVYQSDL